VNTRRSHVRRAGIAAAVGLLAAAALPATISHAAPAAAHYTLSEENDGCGSNPKAACYPGGNVNIFPSGADDQVKSVGLPWPVHLYGKAYTKVYVSSNGDLQFGVTNSTAQDTFTNEPLPSSSLSAKAGVSPFWDDLVFDATANPIQGVFYRTTTFRSESAFIISWRGTEFDSGIPVRAEVVFYQFSNTITFQYVQTGDGQGGSATIGLQKAPGGPANEWSFNSGGSAVLNMELDWNWS
jgi:hypothetical protein